MILDFFVTLPCGADHFGDDLRINRGFNREFNGLVNAFDERPVCVATALGPPTDGD
jgi:hypothetical protein